MRKRLVAALLTGALAASLAGASGATAAVEFGDNCAANGGVPNYTFVGLTATGNPLPLAAPTSGVITQWKTNVALSEPTIVVSQALQVLRPGPAPLQFTVVAQTNPVATPNGLNVFPARIPILAGDRLALSGAFAPLYCLTETKSDTMALLPGAAPALGSLVTFLDTEEGVRVPVSARIEPDADGDGYGDETQDLCPQSAAFQIACPVVVLDAFAIAGGNAIKVLVATSTAAPVKVTGTAKLGKGAIAKLSAKAKTVAAGKIVSYRLPLPTSLMEKLKQLEPGKKLTVKITARATNVAGQVTKDKLKVKLKGQG